MADMYKFKVKQSDLILACENYLRFRRHKANKERIRFIHALMSPSKKFFGLITVKPLCKTVKCAIRYMKSTHDGLYPGSLWSACAFSGSRWTDMTRQLLNELRTNKVRGDVYLTDSMSFLLKWIKE